MSIAYLISAHTDAPQLKRLVEALHPDAHFFIHIDAKTNITPFKSAIFSPRVHFIEDRYDVRWGTIIEVFYQMRLIAAAVDFPVHFDRIFFLSGMDYPLWSNERITSWLEQQGDREILQGICMDTPYINLQQQKLYRTSRPFFALPFLSNMANQRLGIACRQLKALFGLKKKLHLSNGWKLYKGSAWWCISQELAEHVLDVFCNTPEVLGYFRDSFGSAETLIQTIAFNSPYWAQKCILTEGEYPGLAALTPLHFIIYEPVIKIMDEADYDVLMNSGRMFTRKLVSGKSDKLVKMLEEYRGR